jgi:hypothetical protein
MLPLVISTQVETALKSFLLNSFDMSTPLFRRADGTSAIDDFLAEPGNLFKSQHIPIKLPFRQSKLKSEYYLHFYLSNLPSVPFDECNSEDNFNNVLIKFEHRFSKEQ